MKRLIAFASATVLGLSVAACGGAEEEEVLEEDTMMVEEPMMGDDLGTTDDLGMEAETDVLGAEDELMEDEMGAEGVVEEETM